MPKVETPAAPKDIKETASTNGEEEEGKKLTAGFAASEEELNQSIQGVSFGYTVQEMDGGADPKFSNIVAITVDAKGRKQKEKFFNFCKEQAF